MTDIIGPADLSSKNSFALPCQAARLVMVDSAEKIKKAFLDFDLNKKNSLILGGGSNVILPEVLDCTVLQYSGKSVRILEQEQGAFRVEIDAGVVWDDLVKQLVEKDLRGIENLSLIPGTVGAAPVQNIGAYGVEICDVLESVHVLNLETLQPEVFSREQCQFSYRDSLFKQNPGKYFIVKVCLGLSKNNDFTLSYGGLSELKGLADLRVSGVRAKVIQLRQEKLPDPKELPNAGSFFKNPIVGREQSERLRLKFPEIVYYQLDNTTDIKLAAAWLIDQAGWKGYRDETVGVHDQQALVLVNHGEATQEQLLYLKKRIQHSVLDLFGIRLEVEPIICKSRHAI